ncbi:MAG: M23 family metallopeptidase, partial [Mycobacteriaceae bacterium]
MQVLRSTALHLSLVFIYVLGSPAPSHAQESPPPTGSFQWPLIPQPSVLLPFNPPAQRWNSGHRGVDLTAIEGQQVLAAGNGDVVFAGQLAGREVISIQHSSGIRTTYEPVHPTVAVGSAVIRGTVIGTVLSGHPGCPQPTCLHWGARRGSGSD